MNRNSIDLRNAIKNQDENALEMLLPEIINAARGDIEQKIKRNGCRCDKHELVNSFAMEQMVILREQLICDPSFMPKATIPEILTEIRKNLKLYDTLALNLDQNLNNSVMMVTAISLAEDFKGLLEDHKDHKRVLQIFIEQQFKKYRIALKSSPLDFLDINSSGFVRFARKNILECLEINKKIRSKIKDFIGIYFFQKEWYKGQPDKQALIIEDLTEDLLLEFNRKIAQNRITNPYGLLNIICKRRIIDDYNQKKAEDLDNVDKNDPENKKASRSAETSYKSDGSMDPLSRQNVVTELDLKMLREKLEKNCPKPDHVILLRLHLEGYSYDEIAPITNYTSDSVKTIVHNIKVKIRKGTHIADLLND